MSKRNSLCILLTCAALLTAGWALADADPRNAVEMIDQNPVADQEPAPETTEKVAQSPGPGFELEDVTSFSPLDLQNRQPTPQSAPSCSTICQDWRNQCLAAGASSSVCRDALFDCVVCCKEIGQASWPVGVPPYPFG